MKRTYWLWILVLVGLLAAVPEAQGQARNTAYIAYVYPAGGQQGTTFQIRLGGQRLIGLQDVLVSGTGVSAKVIDYYRRLNNQEVTLLREQLKELKRPNPQDADAEPQQDEVTSDMIARIESRMAEHVNQPACISHADLAFVEVTIAPDAQLGAREIRLVTQRGTTNPLEFHIGQVNEFARKPMKTCPIQVLGKEQFAQRNRPADEVEVRVALPCTVNGQVGSGEVNRYRFLAHKGQRLVISTAARQLIPYIADAVPGWFQPVLTLYDAKGKEVAFNDDFRFKPDPTLYFEVPEEGEFVLEIRDAIYRGREDFVYRTTIGELPFVTSIFPLGARSGDSVSIEMTGWNLDKVQLVPPPTTATAGVYQIVATGSNFVSNSMPFALDTLPECLDIESNNEASHAQPIQLPIIVNGRMDQPGDCDVFQFDGHAGDVMVAEVTARRLDSPMDSELMLTDAAGKVVAFNDDHEDLGSGLNTYHADSYLMVELPADGTYYVHVGETTGAGGQAYGYRLRLSAPRPDFALRAVPSSLALRSKGNAPVTVYAIRKDGFSDAITLTLKDPPAGFASPTVTLRAGVDKVRFPIRTQLSVTERPVSLTIEGAAKTQDGSISHDVVPAEDWMQAFLWRHLVPAEDLQALVFDPSYQPPPSRVPPEAKPNMDVAKPAKEAPKFTQRQVAGRLRQLKLLYEEWLLTDEFYSRQVAECEAAL